MKKRSVIAMALLVINLLALLSGCAAKQPEPQPDTKPVGYDCPPSVCWNDKVYYCFNGGTLPYDKIKQDKIVGRITSIVDLQYMPAKNGEANYRALKNAPIAEYEGELYIYNTDYYWYRLTPAEAADVSN